MADTRPRAYVMRQLNLAPLSPVTNHRLAAKLFLFRMRRADQVHVYRGVGIALLASVFATGLLVLWFGSPPIGARLGWWLQAVCIVGLIGSYPAGEVLGSATATRGLRMPDEVAVAAAVTVLIRDERVDELRLCYQAYPRTVEHWLDVLRRGAEDSRVVALVDGAARSLG